MKNTFKKIFSWILLVGWCALIFYFSAKDAAASTADSDKLVLPLMKSDSKTTYNILTFIMRKSAHFFLYFVLGALALQLTYTTKHEKKKAIAFSFCVIYAISDEIHQIFVPNRSCQITDMLIDSIGAFLSIMLISHIIQYVQHKKYNYQKGN